MKRVFIVALKVLMSVGALSIPILIYYFLFITWETPGLEGQVQLAKELGIDIVDLRKLPEPGESIELADLERAPTAIEPSAKQTLFLFLHGYNNTHLMAVASGNRVYQHLLKAQTPRRCRTVISPECREKFHNRFLAFSWRGDFGDAGFPFAETSADKTGVSFASLLRQVSDWHGRHPEAKVVLLAHSLGSRVALEALCHARASDAKQFVDLLVLVQPAVSWHLLKFGLFRATTFPHPRAHEDAPHIEQAFLYKGKYYDCIDAAREVVVITSPKDTVLIKYFSATSDDGSINTLMQPNPRVALGEKAPNFGFRVSHSSYHEISLGDISDVKDLDHSGLFNDPAIMDYIWRWWVYPKFLPPTKPKQSIN
jgi:pimeloyl-ACP methyl ester carboxylesterase